MEDLFSFIDLGYAVILEAYNSFFSGKIISDIILAFKLLAIALFLLSIWTNMVSKMTRSWGVDNETSDLPYNSNKLLTSFIFVLLISIYDKLLLFLDGMFLPLDHYFSASSPLGITIVEESVEQETSLHWKNAITNIGTIFGSLTLGDSFGSNLLTAFFYSIAKAIDAMIFGLFLIERFFMLGLLKLLGPFAIAVSIYKAGNEHFMRWLKLYIATFLLIIPFFLVIGFSNTIATIISNAVTKIPIVDVLMGRSIEVGILIFLIWVKLKLFKKSYDMVYKLFA